MNSILTCKSCGAQIKSPVQGPPGSMMTNCPQCGNKVNILYD